MIRHYLLRKPSAVLATAAVGLALVIAGCGGSNTAHPKTVGSASAGPSQPAQATTPAASSTTRPAASSSTAGIPQHNGGDQDADNNGGPSDGDGAL